MLEIVTDKNNLLRMKKRNEKKFVCPSIQKSFKDISQVITFRKKTKHLQKTTV